MQFDIIGLFFYIFAFTAFFFSIGVIVARSPMHSAISLVLTLVALAGLFLVLHAEFLAWILIIVYTGAVMVLIIFVISLLNLQSEVPIQFTTSRSWGVLIIAAFLTTFFVYLYRDPMVGFQGPLYRSIPSELQWGSAHSIAVDMFTRYVLPFELAAMLLTATVIGAILLARKPEEDKRDQNP
ncbi:MAG: NADH-quinone oxidoreductase subunit J [bacterium]|jgi:NADH-quinone oxidoreductase subunit J